MPKLTVPKIQEMKRDGKKIAMLTAYDFPSAALADTAGVDMLLVGDSVANVVQGKTTTLPVTLEEIIYHAEMVVRAAKTAFVVVDIPFPFFQMGPLEAIKAGARILKESGADAVKVEGGENRAQTVSALVEAGIPVVGHCGLLPQDVLRDGGYVVRRQQDQLQRDVEAVQNAGAFSVVLECVTQKIASAVTQRVNIPTIGIGSGVGCDGQVLVFHDLLGFKPSEPSRTPKHVRRYADLGRIISEAVTHYVDEVRSGTFPGDENSW